MGPLSGVSSIECHQIFLVVVRYSVCKFLWIYGIIVSFFFALLASLCAFSLPSMFVCTWTLYIVVGWILLGNISSISFNIILSRWLLCCVGCLICVLITYRPFRQSVNMCVGSLGNLLFIFWIVWCIAINSTLKIFCNPGSLTTNSIFLTRLYIPYPIFSLVQQSPISWGGRKEQFV